MQKRVQPRPWHSASQIHSCKGRGEASWTVMWPCPRQGGVSGAGKETVTAVTSQEKGKERKRKLPQAALRSRATPKFSANVPARSSS